MSITNSTMVFYLTFGDITTQCKYIKHNFMCRINDFAVKEPLKIMKSSKKIDQIRFLLIYEDI